MFKTQKFFGLDVSTSFPVQLPKPTFSVPSENPQINYNKTQNPTIQRLTILLLKSSLKMPVFFSQNMKIKRLSEIAFIKMTTIVVRVCRMKIYHNHAESLNGPCKNLMIIITWTVRFQQIPVQHMEETNLLTMVLLLSVPYRSYQMLE
jgi:hypothetical protein